VYCPTHRNYLRYAGVSGTTWTKHQAEARRYTKAEALAATKRATWLDHNPTPWALPDGAPTTVTITHPSGQREMVPAGAHRLYCTGPALAPGVRQERTWECSCGIWAMHGYDTPVKRAHREHRTHTTHHTN
jgi:hypothetical protein